METVNHKKKNKIRKGLLAVILFGILIFLANLLHSIYSYKLSEKDVLSIAINTQLICPTVTSIYLDINNKDIGNFLNNGKQLYINRAPTIILQKRVEGKLVYHFGQPTIIYEQKEMIIQDIHQQSYYSETNSSSSILLPEEKGYYYYYLRFDSPKDFEKAIIELTPFYIYDKDSTFDYGIAWIPIKTSDDCNDITIGMRGNLTQYFTYELEDTNNAQYNYVNNLPEKESRFFKQTLNWLVNNPVQQKYAINTGLYGDISINYADRLKYINENGYIAYGAYVFGNELLLKKLELGNFILQSYVKISL